MFWSLSFIAAVLNDIFIIYLVLSYTNVTSTVWRMNSSKMQLLHTLGSGICDSTTYRWLNCTAKVMRTLKTQVDLVRRKSQAMRYLEYSGKYIIGMLIFYALKITVARDLVKSLCHNVYKRTIHRQLWWCQDKLPPARICCSLFIYAILENHSASVLITRKNSFCPRTKFIL